jgi:hypothetical protein
MIRKTSENSVRAIVAAVLALGLTATGCWEVDDPTDGQLDDGQYDQGEDPGTQQIPPDDQTASAVDDQPAFDESSLTLEGGEGSWHLEGGEAEDPFFDDLPELPAMPCVAPDREEYMEAHADPDDEDAGKDHTILFVFDKSGSMSGSWEDETKWAVAAAAMIDSVSLFQHYLSAGALFFPTDYDCGVLPIEESPQIDFTDGSSYLGQWESSMSVLGPNGATPMNTAFEQADQAIRDACEDGILDKPFKVVVLGDGEPNCTYDWEYLLAYPYHWWQHGIETLVVGLPGSESAAELLGMIAYAGGTESEFTPDDPGDFEDEMDAICE